VIARGGALSHSATVTLAVQARPDFTVSLNPAALSIARGRSASAVATVASAAGFAGQVTLSTQSLPAGVSVFYSRNPLTPTATSTLTVRVARTATRGTYNLTVTGSGGGLSHSRTLTVNVT
jgi:hypothetical protein